ncbi:MAG: hypothetical protein SNJ70_09535 [Armatimonadota bacterium]
MLKIKAEWHHRCCACGTTLIGDFLVESEQGFCPWCGQKIYDEKESSSEIRNYVSEAVAHIEDAVNNNFICN